MVKGEVGGEGPTLVPITWEFYAHWTSLYWQWFQGERRNWNWNWYWKFLDLAFLDTELLAF
jgi:hypothetical protein